MSDPSSQLLKANLKQLRLPTIGAEFEKLAREAGAANEDHQQYLLRLTEVEVATRDEKRGSRPASITRRSRSGKDFDTFDCTAVPLGPQAEGRRAVRAANGIDQHFGCLASRSARDWASASGHGPGPGRVLARATGAILHGGGAGHRPGGGPEAIPPRPPPRSGSTGRTCLICDELGFASSFQPRRGGAAVPGFCRPLRTREPVDHQQSGIRRLGSSVPGREDDRRAAGSAGRIPAATSSR